MTTRFAPDSSASRWARAMLPNPSGLNCRSLRRDTKAGLRDSAKSSLEQLGDPCTVQEQSRSRQDKSRLRRLPTGVQTFQARPWGLRLSHRRDRLCLPVGQGSQTLLPVSTLAVRQEPLRGHPQPGVRWDGGRAAQGLARRLSGDAAGFRSGQSRSARDLSLGPPSNLPAPEGTTRRHRERAEHGVRSTGGAR